MLVAEAGDVYVVEDNGNLEIVALTAGGAVKPILRIEGQSSTELTGPALSPDGQRLYFSSQRGPGPNGNRRLTYEISGPFTTTTEPVPALGSIGGVALGARFALEPPEEGKDHS